MLAAKACNRINTWRSHRTLYTYVCRVRVFGETRWLNRGGGASIITTITHNCLKKALKHTLDFPVILYMAKRKCLKLTICNSSSNCCHDTGSTHLGMMSLYAVALQYLFTGTIGPNLFQHANAPMYKSHGLEWRNSFAMSYNIDCSPELFTKHLTSLWLWWLNKCKKGRDGGGALLWGSSCRWAPLGWIWDGRLLRPLCHTRVLTTTPPLWPG